jgi:hypothetical protein
LWGIDQAARFASSYGTTASVESLYDGSWLIDQVRQWRHAVEALYEPLGREHDRDRDGDGARPPAARDHPNLADGGITRRDPVWQGTSILEDEGVLAPSGRAPSSRSSAGTGRDWFRR